MDENFGIQQKKYIHVIALLLVCMHGNLFACLAKALDEQQPLSKIALHRVTLQLSESTLVQAYPQVLGLQGLSEEWVTVNIKSSQPSPDDWIGVFTPAKFNSSTCPYGHNYKEQTPHICSSPVKYKFVNSSNPLYVKTGKASMQFLLINQRSDFSFALFGGGLSNPKLIAVSNSISFKNPKAPLYPRLAQGKSWNEMTVTWTSGYDLHEAKPLVEWGPRRKMLMQSPAETATFDVNSMCGPPAATVGWRDPGFIHTSSMKNLTRKTVYVYRVGHRLSSGAYVWSKRYRFKSSPPPGEESLQRLIIFGDMGKLERDGSNDYNDKEPGALLTTDRLIKEARNFDMVIHIGDLTYTDGYIAGWDQFTSQVEPIASRKPYMTASGNHERDWPNSGSIYKWPDSGGECGILSQTMFYVPAEDRAKLWYSLDYGMFHFCIGNSELDWLEGSEQHKFIEQCLASVDRKKQPWLIFATHRVLGYSSMVEYAENGKFAEANGRETIEKLLKKYEVDIAFYGHAHCYERTCPVHQSQCTTVEKSDYSGPLNGTINAVVGGAGRKLDTFSSPSPSWSVYRDIDFGFVKLTASNYSYLLYEYVRSRDGQVYDSFSITKNYNDVSSQAAAACEQNGDCVADSK